MNIIRIKETCIYISDLHRTKEFYTGILKLPLISLVENRHAFFRAGDSVLLCFIAEQTKKEKTLPPHGATGSIHFAFETGRDDYAIALNQIKTAGIAILHEHEWKGGRRSFYFHDPDDNLVEIIQEGIWD
jgi:catechol 2,3-dioxygenase-like lactoylglutathione lyase family enzyme